MLFGYVVYSTSCAQGSQFQASAATRSNRASGVEALAIIWSGLQPLTLEMRSVEYSMAPSHRVPEVRRLRDAAGPPPWRSDEFLDHRSVPWHDAARACSTAVRNCPLSHLSSCRSQHASASSVGGETPYASINDLMAIFSHHFDAEYDVQVEYSM